MKKTISSSSFFHKAALAFKVFKEDTLNKPTDARGSPVARLLSGVYDGRAVAVTLVYVACTLEGALGVGRDGLRLHARRIRNHRATDGERQGLSPGGTAGTAVQRYSRYSGTAGTAYSCC